MKSEVNGIDRNIELGVVNKAFEGDNGQGKKEFTTGLQKSEEKVSEKTVADQPERQKWGNPLEFLMSCIAMSVGLGNVWRFPFTAFENGGGAFLIPYIIVLLLIGKPLYYMEMAIGQFSSRGAVKVWEMCPALVGIGYGQMYATFLLLTYYCSLMALTVYYLFGSFSSQLPWATCDPAWERCIHSMKQNSSNFTNATGSSSSSELYFLRTVLDEKETIDDGIGIPNWKLVLALLLSWSILYLVLIKGIKGAGRVAYFLAMFPYVVLLTLLIRGVTLPGALDGIRFFVQPKWGELLKPTVWFAAVAQAFFSLSACMGTLIMYASYNEFSHNIYRDSLIVTSMDTLTSFMAGCTIFAILGNLAHELGTDDIANVVKGGASLAFVSYPDAIAKFDLVPQFFSVVFFLMLLTLGAGSAVALVGALSTVICDQFPKFKQSLVSLVICVSGFLIGIVYTTPGGQFILNIVDYYGVTEVVFILATVEMVAIAWIYGVDNLCDDIEFMLGHKVGRYWRVSWGIVTPGLLIIILIYFLSNMESVTYREYVYPDRVYAICWVMMAFGIIQCPFWALVTMYKMRNKSFTEMLRCAFQPTDKWGPKDEQTRKEWIQFKDRKKNVDNINIEENLLWKFLRQCCGINKKQQQPTDIRY